MKYNNYLQAVEFDKELCSTIAMEELSELIQAISKAKRGKLNKDNMEEEISDVLICIVWLIDSYNLSYTNIDNWVKFKTNRIVDRLNKGEFK